MRLRPTTPRLLWALVLAAAIGLPPSVHAASEPEGQPVSVRHTEGQLHAFVALRTLAGETIAAGDLSQDVSGGRVTARLVFRFRDGSVCEETVVFTQRGTFKVLSHSLEQKGPAFERRVEQLLDARTGDVVVRTTDDGKEKVYREHFDMPADLANGLLPVLLKNIDPKAERTTFSMILPTPKPRLIRLHVSAAGEQSFSIAGTTRKAVHFRIHPEITGAARVIAPLIGKKPPDSHVWVFGGPSPVFLRSEAPLAMDGPVLRVDVVGPIWPGKGDDQGAK